jgi:hypothetical protein
MTSCIKVIIYDHCQKLNILNEEQKGCVKECFGCKEQLIIDTVIMEQARKNNRNICTKKPMIQYHIHSRRFFKSFMVLSSH